MGWELPFEVVLGIVAVGVPAVVLLTHLSGSAPPPLDEAAVQALLAREAPTTTAVRIAIGTGGTCALATTDDGKVWVAWVMESHHAIRTVPPGGLSLAAAGVQVQLHDPGWPPRVVPLPGPGCAGWVEGQAA